MEKDEEKRLFRSRILLQISTGKITLHQLRIGRSTQQLIVTTEIYMQDNKFKTYDGILNVQLTNCTHC